MNVDGSHSLMTEVLLELLLWFKAPLYLNFCHLSLLTAKQISIKDNTIFPILVVCEELNIALFSCTFITLHCLLFQFVIVVVGMRVHNTGSLSRQKI